MLKERNKVLKRNAILILSGLLSSCQLLDSSFFSDEMGVPLTEFNAKDGDYFPPFVQKYFPATQTFSKDYPTLKQAREGVRLIALRKLNSAAQTFNEANLSWSEDGVYLGFEVITSRHRKIMLKSLEGAYTRELYMIPKGPQNFLDGMVAPSAHSYNAGLRWSRDSTRFAFMSNGGMGAYNIYVGAIGVQEESIASSPTKDGYATWSPKTNEIAFVSGRTGNGDIYTVTLNNQKVERLSHENSVDIFPEWFPSGRKIVYVSGDALNHDIWMLERNEGESESRWSLPRQITKSRVDELRPTVSPDGKLIAYYAESSHHDSQGLRRWNIIVLSIDDIQKNSVPLKDSQIQNHIVAEDVVIDLNTGPAWTPDSRKIFYVKREPSTFNPIQAFDLYSGRRYQFKTDTRMNRDILVSKLGVLSFRAQVGVWDRVFVALTNQGLQLQENKPLGSIQEKIHYKKM